MRWWCKQILLMVNFFFAQKMVHKRNLTIISREELGLYLYLLHLHTFYMFIMN